VGNEGICGYTLIMRGNVAPLRALVQGTGNNTDAMLLDQEALRNAAIDAGLEKPESR